MSSTALQKKFSVPIQISDMPVFDDAFSAMKERFDAEMRRVDQEMTKFNSDLMRVYGQTTTVQAISGSAQPTKKELPLNPTNWDTIMGSPLIEGDGESKSLKLQYDVRQFDPSEVKVKILNDILYVSATHEEKTDSTMVYREYNREFRLPKGINPAKIVSALSKDGVLIVQAPLPQPVVAEPPLRISSQ